MQTTLRKLLDGAVEAKVSGDLKRSISFLATDSRRAGPGCLFFALPGARTDGSHYIEEAIDRGAAAVVTEEIRRPHAGVVQIRVPDARVAMAKIARRFFENPDDSLAVFEVAGLRGKSTTATFMQHLLAAGAGPVGLIGSIAYDLGRRTLPSVRTTPDAVELMGLLGEIRDAGAREAVVEIDWMGVRQKSAYGLRTKIVVVTNIAGETLENGESMDSRRDLVRELLGGNTAAAPEVAVINVDDPEGRRLASNLPAGIRIVTFGRSPAADVRAETVATYPDSNRLTLAWPEGTAEMDVPVAGEHNVAGFLAAAATCYAAGRDPAGFAASLTAFPGVPGRMEPIDRGQAFRVFVDHGHTPETLAAVLDSLRRTTPGKVLVVFGCGGGRNRSARAVATRTIQERADFFWATADNTRGEPLERIFSDMKTGVIDENGIAFVDDRRVAIDRAFQEAGPGDCVLLAGKGHEAFLEMGHTLLPFDDRLVAADLLALPRI